MSYGSKLHVLPIKYFLAAQPELYNNVFWKKSQKKGPLANIFTKQKEQVDGAKTRGGKIGKGNLMSALMFQTRGKHQISTASLQECWKKKQEKEMKKSTVHKNKIASNIVKDKNNKKNKKSAGWSYIWITQGCHWLTSPWCSRYGWLVLKTSYLSLADKKMTSWKNIFRDW